MYKRQATGIAQCDGQLVTILDFEKIVAELAPETTIQVSEVDAMGAVSYTHLGFRDRWPLAG